MIDDAELVSADVQMLLDGLGISGIQSLQAVIAIADPSVAAIPRRLAKRLLSEYDARVEAEFGSSDAEAEERLESVRNGLLGESPLVVRVPETVDGKARRYLAEGRLTIQRFERGGLVVASCRGSAGAVYRLGYDPRKREWRCTCPSPGKRARCSHVLALRLVLGR